MNNAQYELGIIDDLWSAPRCDTDDMSDKQVVKYLDEQIVKFKKIGNGFFEVDSTLIHDLPPKITALIIREINTIFEEYPNIIRHVFVEHLKRENKKFLIQSFIPTKKSIVAETNLYTMSFNKNYFSSQTKVLSMIKKNLERGFASPTDNNRFIEHIVAHEAGHLIQKLLTNPDIHPKNHVPYTCLGITMQNTGKPFNELIDYKLIKTEILTIANREFYYCGNAYICKYGTRNDKEWFAEVCAHYFCSKRPNALGLAFKNFMNNWEKIYGGSIIYSKEIIETAHSAAEDYEFIENSENHIKILNEESDQDKNKRLIRQLQNTVEKKKSEFESKYGVTYEFYKIAAKERDCIP